MRKLVFLLCLIGYISGAQAEEGNGTEEAVTLQEARVQVMDRCTEDPAGSDCTIRVNFTTDDGTRIQGELTFVDISWWECTKIKIGNFLMKIF